MMRFACPFCYKTMPPGYEVSVWKCCGEKGHAVGFPECPKCRAEITDGSIKCEICGFDLTETQILSEE